MKVIILAAGEGAGTNAPDDNTPKCFLRTDAETVLHRRLRMLQEAGFSADDITLVVGRIG